MATHKSIREAKLSKESGTFEEPPYYRLPDEPPLLVTDPKPNYKRNRRSELAGRRLPLDQRIAALIEHADSSLHWANVYQASGQYQAADC